MLFHLPCIILIRAQRVRRTRKPDDKIEKRMGVIMQKLEQLYEGKAKKVFKTDDPDIVIVDYKDDATAFNGEKKGTIVGKGVINNTF